VKLIGFYKKGSDSGRISSKHPNPNQAGSVLVNPSRFSLGLVQVEPRPNQAKVDSSDHIFRRPFKTRFKSKSSHSRGSRFVTTSTTHQHQSRSGLSHGRPQVTLNILFSYSYYLFETVSYPNLSQDRIY